MLYPCSQRVYLFSIAALLVTLVGSPVAAQDSIRHKGGEGHGDHYQHRFDNPERFADDWNDPERDAWQKPSVILEAMGVEPGMTVADLGTGTGYFIPHLARAVGAEGQVLAVDIESAMLGYVQELAEKRSLTVVDTVLAAPNDTHLDPSSVDRILTVNTWHHIPERGAYADHLARRLKEGGTVWVVDFENDAPMGPPRKHRLSPEAIVRELEAGGLDAEVRGLGLPHQFVVVGRCE